MKPKPRWRIEELSRQVHRLTFPDIKTGWEQWVLIQTDEHWDNSHCDRKLLERHHREAVERNAPILKFGDVFCLMQGKWDKRADQNQLRPEHRGNNYFDLVVNDAVDFYRPFADNIALVTPGNHESSVLDRHQTNIAERFVTLLKGHGSNVHLGGYWGYVVFRFECGKQLSKHLHYHHGYGGGGEVTRGMIDNNRTRGQYMADIYVSGHIHRRNSDENILTECVNNKIATRQQLFLRSGTYKEEHLPGGWHAVQGRAGRPLGGWWLRFAYTSTGRDGEREILVQEMRAT